ncbi:hypothetical protein V500_04080 [Pseudogymnoascus sp. VKM F-4518 (FW-2643)]|nr:hypothetical protein V500_04080 [Pseudogymnoascus sp. VKM F-4518 (FW-2643)]
MDSFDTTFNPNMPTTNAKGVLDATFEHFATSLLPLYSGPLVTIRIASHEYKLPTALLCKQSPYFAATFNGSFREGEEQSVNLEEIDGVVSIRSFQMLVQWVCLGRVVFGESAPKEAITTAIEVLYEFERRNELVVVLQAVQRARGGATGRGVLLYFELTPSAIRRNGDDVIVNFRVAEVLSV